MKRSFLDWVALVLAALVLINLVGAGLSLAFGDEALALGLICFAGALGLCWLIANRGAIFARDSGDQEIQATRELQRRRLVYLMSLVPGYGIFYLVSQGGGGEMLAWLCAGIVCFAINLLYALTLRTSA